MFIGLVGKTIDVQLILKFDNLDSNGWNKRFLVSERKDERRTPGTSFGKLPKEELWIPVHLSRTWGKDTYNTTMSKCEKF